MKAWIVWGAILPGILMGGIVLARAQAAAQVSAAKGQAGPPPPAGAPPVSSPASPRTRDPFRTVLVKKEAPTAAGPVCTQPGKKSLLIGQLLIQGIARSVDGQWIAVVDNKTKRSYFLREKDEVCNGVVTKVTEESVAFEEIGTDSAGRPRTREVIKRLAGD